MGLGIFCFVAPEVSAIACNYNLSQSRYSPSNSGHHSSRRYYRGGWHRSCPALSSPVIYTGGQPACAGTRSFLITVARMVKFSRLLRPVGPGFVSQNPWQICSETACGDRTNPAQSAGATTRQFHPVATAVTCR